MQNVVVSRTLDSYLPPPIFLPDSAQDEARREPKLSERSTGKDAKQLRVLVVDDSPDVSEMLGMLLSLSGYGVTVASSAAEALDHARAMQFDVVVSDIGMPKMNGYDLARALRGLPGYQTVPMIAVTGFSRYDDRERSLGSGFDAHMTKPLNPVTLLDLIESLMGKG